MLVIKILVQLFVLQNVYAQIKPQEIGVIIGDFLGKTKFPTKITAFLCWHADEMIQFEKTMFDKGYWIQVNNPSFGYIPYFIPEQHHIFIADDECNGTENVLMLADKYKLFKQPFRWVVIGSPDSSLFDNLYISLDSRFYLIYQEASDKYAIKSIYKYIRNSSLIENKVAIWSSRKKFHHFNELCIPKNRTNLYRLQMNVPFVVTNPNTMNHLEDYREKHIDAITKLNYKILNQLVDVVNITPVWIPRETWGYRNTTSGLYSGMIGDLQSGFSSLGGTPCFFTEDRVDAVDFIAATTPTYMKFIFRAPPLSVVTNVFTQPFDKYVWRYSFLMVAATAVVVYIIVIWEWKDPKFRGTVEDKLNCLRPNISDVVMMEVGAISQQGTDVEPRSFAGRTATLCIFVALMFLYTSYSANIVALLQSTSDSIRTLQDLLTSRIKLGVEDIVYAHYYFENAREPTRKAIYDQKVAPKGQKPNFMTADEGIRRMRDEFFGFHVELSTGYKVVSEIFQENEKCGLKEIAYVNLFEPWIAARKNSSYKEIFKVGMRKIHEAGIQKRELNRIYTKKPVCHNKGNNFVSVGITDCYFAFVLFAAGAAISVVLLLMEKFSKIYQCQSLLNEEKINNKQNNLEAVVLYPKVNQLILH